MRALIVLVVVVPIAACGKLGVSGTISKNLGNWAQVSPPSGCVAKQIAAEEHGGIAVLCEDGRLFN